MPTFLNAAAMRFALSFCLIAAASAAQSETLAPAPTFEDQLDGAGLIVVGEIGEVVNRFEFQPNVSGEGGAVRTFTDFEVKVIDHLKGGKTEDKIILRVADKPGGRGANEALSYPVKPGQRVVLTLAPHRFVGDRKDAYAIVYDGYHPLKNGKITVRTVKTKRRQVGVDDIKRALEKRKAQQAKRMEGEPREVRQEWRGKEPRPVQTPEEARPEKPLPLAGPQGPANLGSPAHD